MASRSAIRTAAMDRNGLVPDGASTNEKIIQDVRNFLTASGLPGDEANISIVDPSDHTTPFDLDDPANDLAMFELKVDLCVEDMAGFSDDFTLSNSLVFRNARATLVQ